MLIPIIARAATGDGYAVSWCSPPNLAAGNAQFLDPDPRRLVQLRPLLKSEVSVNGAGREANALLLVRGEGGQADLALYVRVPPHLRKNTRAGVMRAIQCVRRFNKGVADDVCKSVARSTWSTS